MYQVIPCVVIYLTVGRVSPLASFDNLGQTASAACYSVQNNVQVGSICAVHATVVLALGNVSGV